MASYNSQPPHPTPREGFREHRRRSSYAGPLTFFLIMVAMIFVMSVFFRVSDVKVEGNKHYSDEEIIRALDIEDGDNLFFFDRFAALSRAFAKLPYIEKVTIERKLPNKVMIEVVESEALAYITVGDENWSFDHMCKILGKASGEEKESLIAVTGIDPGTLLIGETMTTSDGSADKVDYLSDILYQLEGRLLHHNVGKISFDEEGNAQFNFAGKYTVRLGKNNDTEKKMGMFVSVMDKLKEGDIGIIDLSDGLTAHFSPN